MFASIDFNLTELTVELIKQYGAGGILVIAVFYYIRVTGHKLDTIIQLNNRTFGAIISLLNKRDRNKLTRSDMNSYEGEE